MKEKDKRLLVGKPNIGDGDTFRKRVDGLLERAWLTNNGPLTQELEERLCDRLQVKHCIAMSNGTVALELAIRGNDLKGEVIVPSMTFIATAHALQWQGIRPVFADIDEETLNLCPRSVAQQINENTTGIIGVHLYGRPCNVSALQELADQHGLKLLFDAAHAFGSGCEGVSLGNFGNCEVFSFHATKVFNTFEGGAVTTNDDELARKLRLMRNFGFEGEDEVSYIGTNGKMSEICAAMGLTNLESLDQFIATNKINYQAYYEGLAGIAGIELCTFNEEQKNNYHYVILQVHEGVYGRSRDELKQELEAHGVYARRYFYPGCHRMEPYRSLYPEAPDSLPVTEAFSERVLALPNGGQVGSKTAAKICRIISDYGCFS